MIIIDEYSVDGTITGLSYALLVPLGIWAVRGFWRRHISGPRDDDGFPKRVPMGYREFDASETSMMRWTRFATISEDANRMALLHLYGPDHVANLQDFADRDVIAPPGAPVAVRTELEAIPFRPGEPQRFADMQTHKNAAFILDKFVRNMTRDHPAARPLLFVGGSGRGKTSLVRTFANEARIRQQDLGLEPGYLIEAYGGDLDTADALDARVRRASNRAGSVLAIDEVHSMPSVILERLYNVLDRDPRYQFKGADAPEPVAPFTVVFATTDRGKLPEPLRNRCFPLDIQPVPPEELLHIAMNQPFHVTPEAAKLAVDRVHWDGSVRPLVQLLEVAEEFARARLSRTVAEEDMSHVLASMEIDDVGLHPIDRDVISALMRSGKPAKVKRNESPRTVYQLSEASLLGWARLDTAAYREEVKPRLMDRGFLMSLSSGQTLTDAGVAYAAAKGLNRAA